MKYRQAKKNLKRELAIYAKDLDSNPLNGYANSLYKTILLELKALKDNK